MWSARRRAAGVEIGGRRFAQRLRLDRHRKAIVPEEIEGPRQVPHHRPGDGKVEIAELERSARLEILVAYVAPPVTAMLLSPTKSLLCIL